MPPDKVKITQKEFDEIYQIDETPQEEITGEKPDVSSAKQADTTPEFLTEEEQEQDELLFKDLPDIEDME